MKPKALNPEVLPPPRSECEKLEVAEEEAKNNNMLEGLDADQALRSALTSDQVQEQGVIIINAQGLMQMVNQVGGVGGGSSSTRRGAMQMVKQVGRAGGGGGGSTSPQGLIQVVNQVCLCGWGLM